MAIPLDAAALAAALVSEGGEAFNPLRLTDFTNAVWTIVIFAASLPLMWTIVWGPMARVLEQRDAQADQAVRAAEAAKAAAEQARADVENRLTQAQKESAKMIADARAVGEAQGREVLAAAQDEAQRTLERAKAEIEREKSKALSEIRETVVDLTLEAATKVVGRSFEDADQRRFVEEFVSGGAPKKPRSR